MAVEFTSLPEYEKRYQFYKAIEALTDIPVHFKDYAKAKLVKIEADFANREAKQKQDSEIFNLITPFITEQPHKASEIKAYLASEHNIEITSNKIAALMRLYSKDITKSDTSPIKYQAIEQFVEVAPPDDLPWE